MVAGGDLIPQGSELAAQLRAEARAAEPQPRRRREAEEAMAESRRRRRELDDAERERELQEIRLQRRDNGGDDEHDDRASVALEARFGYQVGDAVAPGVVMSGRIVGDSGVAALPGGGALAVGNPDTIGNFAPAEESNDPIQLPPVHDRQRRGLPPSLCCRPCCCDGM